MCAIQKESDSGVNSKIENCGCWLKTQETTDCTDEGSDDIRMTNDEGMPNIESV